MDLTFAESLVRADEFGWLSDFEDLKEFPNPYIKNLSKKYEKAHPRQRGYIHGLSKKLGIDDNIELPYIVKDVRNLDVEEAGEVIEILKELWDEQNMGGALF